MNAVRVFVRELMRASDKSGKSVSDYCDALSRLMDNLGEMMVRFPTWGESPFPVFHSLANPTD